MKSVCSAFLAVIFSTAVSSHADEPYPIAGTQPDSRPAGAPVIEWVRHDQAWFKHALTGIHPPFPRSLYFLDNQGNWYTPFNHPGMTGPYDLRGWHKK
jgi:hypothetical protein